MSTHNNWKRNESEWINKKAYELWEQGGRKHGHALNNWLEAEKAVKSQTKKS